MPATLAIVALAAAAVTAALIVLTYPLLARYALARPDARSSHRVPTPQGGGIAVLAGVFLAAGVALAVTGTGLSRTELVALGLAALVLAAVGVFDDIRPLPVAPRLALQTFAVAAVIYAAGPDIRLLPDWVPLVAERALEIFSGVWFVNLVNFMDGLDWMVVAEAAPLTGALAIFALLGLVPRDLGLIAATLLGGMLGFAPFNRPVARLFLGDVGSLPIGLLMAWLLYRLAEAGGLAAAVLLPLYYCADATITLMRRSKRGERLWQAHRSHFYQRATDNGFSTLAVVGHVAALNVALAGLAAASLVWPTPRTHVAILALGGAAVALVLWRFSRVKDGRGRTTDDG